MIDVKVNQELLDQSIFDFLKQNLKIQVSETYGRLTVKLDLCDILIASDTCYLSNPSDAFRDK